MKFIKLNHTDTFSLIESENLLILTSFDHNINTKIKNSAHSLINIPSQQ